MKVLIQQCARCQSDLTPRQSTNDDGIVVISGVCECGWLNYQHFFTSRQSDAAFEVVERQRPPPLTSPEASRPSGAFGGRL